MNKFKVATCFFVLSLVAFVVPRNVLAADLDVSCDASSCSKSGSDPLFSASDGDWFPGRSLSKTAAVINDDSQTREAAVMGERSGSQSTLEDVLQLTIAPSSGGSNYFSGTLANFYQQGEITLGSIASGSSIELDFTLSMDTTAGNSYQDSSAAFDLTFGFTDVPITPTPTSVATSTPSTTPSPTPTQTPTPTQAASSTNNASTVTSSSTTSTSPPTCNDSAPGGAPKITSALVGTNSVILKWDKALDPVTYYLIAYGTESGSYIYGNPNVGDKDTTSYTIRNLSGNTTYYFVVRAGNGCKPGSLSSEVSATPTGPIVRGTASGFSPNVLGVATKEIATKEAEVLSSTAELASSDYVVDDDVIEIPETYPQATEIKRFSSIQGIIFVFINLLLVGLIGFIILRNWAKIKTIIEQMVGHISLTGGGFDVERRR